MTVVHLELHTHDLDAARTFYTELLRWPAEQVHHPYGTYHGLMLGDRLAGGIVECGTDRARWLPYAEVGQIAAATERARDLGASVLLDQREGPSGWRSVVWTPAGGEIALWQQKR